MSVTMTVINHSQSGTEDRFAMDLVEQMPALHRGALRLTRHEANAQVCWLFTPSGRRDSWRPWRPWETPKAGPCLSLILLLLHAKRHAPLSIGLVPARYVRMSATSTAPRRALRGAVGS
jgi:hypothetical protein